MENHPLNHAQNVSNETEQTTEVETPSSPKLSKRKRLLLNLLVLASPLILTEAAHAATNPITNAIDWVVTLLTSDIARSAAIVGIAILGYLAWVGRLAGDTVGKFILGIVLVFGGATIVDLIIAAL